MEEKICKAVERFYKESKSKNYTAAGIRFRDNSANRVFSYDTEMDKRRPSSAPLSGWSKSDWRDFIDRAINYYHDNSRFSIDRIEEIFFVVHETVTIL